jgi:hypothetical protein
MASDRHPTDEPQPGPTPARGLGDVLEAGYKDTRLTAKAVKERWPIPAELRPALVIRLARIVADKTASPREVTTASRAILEADRINLDAEKLDLEERVAKLEEAITDGDRGSDSQAD